MSTTMMGNLVKDPELRQGRSGNQSVVFPLAVTRNWRDAEGRWHKDVSYFRCVLWGPAAVNVATSLAKGMRVVAFGRMGQQNYTEGDARRSAVEFVVEDIGPSLRNATAVVTRAGSEPAPSAGGGSGLLRPS